MEHLTDDELEQHLMGSMPEGPELVRIKEHLIWCEECMNRSLDTELYLKVMEASQQAASGKRVRI